MNHDMKPQRQVLHFRWLRSLFLHCTLMGMLAFAPSVLKAQAMGLERRPEDSSFLIPDTLTYAMSQNIDFSFNFVNGDTILYYVAKSGYCLKKGTIITIGRPFTGITLYNPNKYRYEVKYHEVHEGRANLVRTNPEGLSERLEGQEFQILDMVIFHTRPGRKSSLKLVLYIKSLNSKRILTISDYERAVQVGELQKQLRN